MFKKAEQAYMKSIEKNRKYAFPWYNLGGLYWNNKLFEKAIDVWDEAIKKFPRINIVNLRSIP